MPAKADAPLRKVTLNLYEDDCVALENYYGYGWTEQVRLVVHQHTVQLTGWHKVRKTLGDFHD